MNKATRGPMVGMTASAVPESLPTVLNEIASLAKELRGACGMAADTLSGTIPEDSFDKSPMGVSILDQVREIRSLLQEADHRQQRVMRALAL